MDIVVKGRRTEVSERYRAHVREKLGRLSKLDGKAFRIDVEISHESNPRLAGSCDRVELTVYSRGPVTRAEAAAADQYAALDLATAKLEERMRRAADRRHARQHGHVHGHGHGHQQAVENGASAREHLVDRLQEALPEPEMVPLGTSAAADDAPDLDELGDVLVADGPLVVRQKTHEGSAMSLDDALHHMELVGHDFFLYCDSACGLPSVVYRRRGYTYGVLRLRTEPGAAAAGAGAAAHEPSGSTA